MADYDWSEYTEDQILKKLKGFRTFVTNAVKQMQSLTQRYTAHPNVATGNEIRHELERALSRVETMEEAYTELLEKTQEENKTKLYQVKLEGLNSEKAEMRNMALDALQVAPDGANVSSTPTYKKVNDGLRPEVLSADTTPEELRAWLRQFRSFYTTGNIKDLQVHDQQSWLLRCLDKFLSGRIAAQIKDDTPIFKDPNDNTRVCCIDLIEEEFIRRYPKAGRRHLFYSYKFAKGTPMCQIDDSLCNMAKDADIGDMTEDEHIALRIVCACSDEALKREFLKLRVMSLDNVRATYEAWEQQSNNLA